MSVLTVNLYLILFLLMLITVFTPTHNLSHIADVAASLASQTVLSLNHSIEWTIGYNGSLTESDVISAIGQLPERIKVVFPEIDRSSRKIGDLKRSLCVASTGDILVELDHDDILVENALEMVVNALGGCDDAFVYSNSATFDDKTLTPIIYNPDYGWSQQIITVEAPGTKMHKQTAVGMRSHPPTARSICQVLYAPDHVRVWTRKAYNAAGGHDKDMDVCDDHDLICRTYLNKSTKIIQIPETLYLYRRGSESIPNTFSGELNSKIQALSGQGTLKYPDGSPIQDFAQPILLRDKYLHSLVTTEGARSGEKMIDLGGKIGCPEGWTSIDVSGGDVVRDLRRGLPFADNSVFAIRAFDFFEHLESKDAAWLIGECWRVLRHGGWLLTRTPSESGVGASCDLSHLSRWNTRTWAYFWSDGLREYREQAFPGLKASFQPVRVFEEANVMGPWPCQWLVPYVVADLIAIKGGPKLPGRDFIKPD